MHITPNAHPTHPTYPTIAAAIALSLPLPLPLALPFLSIPLLLIYHDNLSMAKKINPSNLPERSPRYQYPADAMAQPCLLGERDFRKNDESKGKLHAPETQSS